MGKGGSNEHIPREVSWSDLITLVYSSSPVKTKAQQLIRLDPAFPFWKVNPHFQYQEELKMLSIYFS